MIRITTWFIFHAVPFSRFLQMFYYRISENESLENEIETENGTLSKMKHYGQGNIMENDTL